MGGGGWLVGRGMGEWGCGMGNEWVAGMRSGSGVEGLEDVEGGKGPLQPTAKRSYCDRAVGTVSLCVWLVCVCGFSGCLYRE